MEKITFDAQEVTLFADILLPVPIPKLFTYRVPRDMAADIQVGCRVIVEFGRGRVLTAIVGAIHTSPPEKYQAKYILELMDADPIVTPAQLWLFNWIAEYYMCAPGEVMNIALPSGLKVTSESRIQYNPDFDYPELIDDSEKELLDALQNTPFLTYNDATKYVGATQINKVLKSLVKKQAILLYEEVKEKYKPKVQKKIRLATAYASLESATLLMDSLRTKPKQHAIMYAYLTEIGIQNIESKNKAGVLKSFFNEQKELSMSSLQTLLEKGIFESFETIVSRFEQTNTQTFGRVNLTAPQEKALQEIVTHFETKQVTLLHGVTGSGKTEVYIELIQQVLENGSQVLFLLPEIALTTQIVVRLQKVFGDKMGVYHSKFSDNERVEVYQGVLSGKFSFVVGVRSSIFLPFTNLGLILVDEEHETSYKQFDPAPRYHARDVAIMLAMRENAKVLLGSATPALETYYQAKQGRYGLVELTTRFGNAQMPSIQLINMKLERKNKTLKNDFSSALLEAIKQNMANKEQTIIFQNRRGYSPYIHCQTCDWIAECAQCDVSLTFHLRSNELVCHYCGHKETPVRTCPACGSVHVQTVGVGTEKIEDELAVFLPSARVLRMDFDTTRSRHAYQQIIGEFEQGDVDILVGTQMISKGLDFDQVSLVGIFDADRMIHFPDFRASERAFQMLTQVSGRAGRRGTKGKVLIQTKNPEHPLLAKVVANDYLGFYEEEIRERESFNYPPFSRILEVSVKHIDADIAFKAAQQIAAQLKAKLGGKRVLGPEKAMIERVRNKFIFEIWIKLEKDKLNIKATKAFLTEQIEDVLTNRVYKQVQVIVDVDAI